MKNLLLATLSFIFLSLSVAQAQTQGLTQALSNMQSETSEKVKQMLLQSDSERNSGVKTPSKNYAAFTPTPSNNLKLIADKMGKTAEEKAMFLQVFTETKKGFEAQAADKKNNMAAAMTFLMATAVMVYHESPEPSDAATEKLFRGLNSMFDGMPEIANISSKDKQFLYDLYISYGGLILASYEEAKATKSRETIDAIRVIAGSALLDFFKINPTTIYFEGNSLRMKSESGNGEIRQTQSSQPTSRIHTFAKQTTNFTNDGWVSTVSDDYVSIRRNGVEVRLYYDDQQLDNAMPKNTQYVDYYWSKLVTPYFNVSTAEKWAGLGPELAYILEGEGVDRQTGKRCYVVLYNVNAFGARGNYVVIAPNRSVYQQTFPNRDDISNMRGHNKFAVTAQDVIGNWTGGSGNFAEYYNVYSGSYAGMAALSIANDFVFRSNGSYQHIYRSANSNFGSTQFAKLEYNGKFTVTNDWEITATNHYNGITAKFASQIVAVKGGYLLVLTDTRNNINYTLFKKR